LETERSADRITGFEYGLYEAEVHQFGGEVGIRLAHDFFTYDSQALLGLQRLKIREGIQEDLQILSLLVINHLLGRACGDSWEVWDAWRNLGDAGRRFREDLPEALKARLEADFAGNRPLFELITARPGEALDALEPPVRSIVERFFSLNEVLIDSFRQAVSDRKLLFGPRTILPFFVIFHWNRWGFSDIEQRFLSDSMERLFNPKSSRALTR
jgi:thiopeptide-type bacteriocin biosynthesis protein